MTFDPTLNDTSTLIASASAQVHTINALHRTRTLCMYIHRYTCTHLRIPNRWPIARRAIDAIYSQIPSRPASSSVSRQLVLGCRGVCDTQVFLENITLLSSSEERNRVANPFFFPCDRTNT